MAATHHAQSVRQDTKGFITEALLEAVRREPLGQVTVAQVCQRAGVSRMAFYRNFGSLEQVLEEYYSSQVAPVFEVIRRSQSFEEKHDRQQGLFEAIGDEMVLSLRHGFEPVIRRVFVAEIRGFYEGELDAYWLEFLSAGVYAIWQKWLIDGRQRPLREIMHFLKEVDLQVGLGRPRARS